jgi:hypothetical protein
MRKSSRDIPEKKKKRAAKRGTAVLVRLQDDDLRVLDNARHGIFPPPSRPEMLRRFLKEAT